MTLRGLYGRVIVKGMERPLPQDASTRLRRRSAVARPVLGFAIVAANLIVSAVASAAERAALEWRETPPYATAIDAGANRAGRRSPINGPRRSPTHHDRQDWGHR